MAFSALQKPRFRANRLLRVLLGALCLTALPIAGVPATNTKPPASQSSEEIVFPSPSGEASKAKTPEPKKTKFSELLSESVNDMFSMEASLKIPLGEIMLLVVLVNIFALFKMARAILGVSFAFAFYWVILSNYAEFVKQPDSVTRGCWWIFLVCGLLTGGLFLVNYFKRP